MIVQGCYYRLNISIDYIKKCYYEKGVDFSSQIFYLLKHIDTSLVSSLLEINQQLPGGLQQSRSQAFSPGSRMLFYAT